jgi:hypothetical protein
MPCFHWLKTHPRKHVEFKSSRGDPRQKKGVIAKKQTTPIASRWRIGILGELGNI